MCENATPNIPGHVHHIMLRWVVFVAVAEHLQHVILKLLGIQVLPTVNLSLSTRKRSWKGLFYLYLYKSVSVSLSHSHYLSESVTHQLLVAQSHGRPSLAKYEEKVMEWNIILIDLLRTILKLVEENGLQLLPLKKSLTATSLPRWGLTFELSTSAITKS